MQRAGGGTAMRMPPAPAVFAGGLGQPLPQAVQRKMEAFFGTRFDDVRVHVGPQAGAIGALAFTHGSEIYFAPGQYHPGTAHGQRLLGHELTHVVQQRAGRVRNPFGEGVALVQDALLEAEAEQMGARAAAFQMPVQAKMAASPARPASPLPSRRSLFAAIQLKPGIGDLKGISRVALREAGGIEFQAMSVDRAVVLTSNDAV
ncbi:MAG TPA: DUF4157 domain-containing protein, partial [Thermoanaerobaculia bacterium]|nr:DUF4157 domain-containing protein [Thermoanaerobaculia bacterium]